MYSFPRPQRNGFTVVKNIGYVRNERVNLEVWDAIPLGRPLVGAVKDGLDKDGVWKTMRGFEEEIFTRAQT